MTLASAPPTPAATPPPTPAPAAPPVAMATATTAAASTAPSPPANNKFNWEAAGNSLNGTIIAGVVAVVMGLAYQAWQSYLETTPGGLEALRLHTDAAKKLAEEKTKRTEAEKTAKVRLQELEIEELRLKKGQ